MTCIVGLEHKNKVYLGSDSAAVGGWTISTIDESKLFTVKSKSGKTSFMIGYTTSFRFADIMKYHPWLDQDREGNETDKSYLVRVVVHYLRHALKDAAYAKSESNRESGGTALIAFNNKLYTLQDEYSIIRYKEGYAAVGCGDQLALGSLASTHDKAPKVRVKMAIEAAIKHNMGVQGPIHVVEVK